MNANGVLSFNTSFSDFSPEDFPLDSDRADRLIALFWEDHDVRHGGQIFYRFAQDVPCLSEVGSEVSDAFGVNFSPTMLFIATWDEVARYSYHSVRLSLSYKIIAMCVHTTMTYCVCSYVFMFDFSI